MYRRTPVPRTGHLPQVPRTSLFFPSSEMGCLGWRGPLERPRSGQGVPHHASMLLQLFVLSPLPRRAGGGSGDSRQPLGRRHRRHPDSCEEHTRSRSASSAGDDQACLAPSRRAGGCLGALADSAARAGGGFVSSSSLTPPRLHAPAGLSVPVAFLTRRTSRFRPSHHRPSDRGTSWLHDLPALAQG